MHLDIFKDDAFSLSQLSVAMVNLPHTPTRIGDLGYFKGAGINTLSMTIESVGATIALVPTAPRGSSGKVYTNEKRTLRTVSAVHLPQRAAILADQVQGVRAFGTETELQTAQGMMSEKLAAMRRDIDLTMEWQRLGAIKGQVLDADGSSVIWDWFSEFGVSQITKDFELDNDATQVILKVLELKRAVEAELGGLSFTGIRVFCSASFFDAFTRHPAVEKAFELYNTAYASSDVRGGFVFAGVTWEEYRGKVGSTDFVEDGYAYAVPEGVPNMFIARFAPADYMETVNTVGLPYYAKQEPMPFGKGIEVEAQSNPIHLNTRPRAVVKLVKF